jgi:hypothetical protein
MIPFLKPLQVHTGKGTGSSGKMLAPHVQSRVLAFSIITLRLGLSGPCGVKVRIRKERTPPNILAPACFNGIVHHSTVVTISVLFLSCLAFPEPAVVREAPCPLI